MRTYGEKPIVFKFDHDETEYMIGSGTYQLFVIYFQKLKFYPGSIYLGPGILSSSLFLQVLSYVL